MKQNLAAAIATARQPRTGAGRRAVRVVGLGLTAGAFLAVGMIPMAAAPQAHADLEDLFQPLVDALAQAVNVVDPGLATSFDPGLDLGGLAEPAAAAAAVENATVPLTVANNGASPLVDISVGGGPSIPVVLDTGSQGVILPWNDLGLQNLFNLFSDHGAFGTVGYGNTPGDPNIDVVYVQDPNTTVDFGNGIETSPTTVDVALFAYPTSSANYFNLDYYSLQGYDSGNGADGTMGIAPQSFEPGPSSPITALPGDLSDGVLINESAGYLEFGPNPMTPLASIDGVPIGGLEVSVGGPGHAIVPVTGDIDSGGLYGTIPASILTGNPTVGGELANGTEIEVYTSDGTPLYTYTVDGSTGPTISGDGTDMNTGNAFFLANPVYLSYDPAGEGTAFID
jgi:hypothetical protein